MKVGIVGLPNVGKSTIFNALTASNIPANNYPFCTIEPNMGIVNIPDQRLQTINSYISTEKIISTSIEFVDIAGLVKGASAGEGLGNQFLSHIRNVDAIVHIVRGFENTDITHVEGSIDPLRDIQIIETELLLKDLETLNKRKDKISKIAKSGDKDSLKELKLLDIVINELDKGNFLFSYEGNESETSIINSWSLLSNKPMFYLCNVDEQDIDNNDNPYFLKLQDYANQKNVISIKLCGSIEMEISKFQNEDDKNDLLNIYGLKEPGLHTLINLAYKNLNLITYFTAGPQEIRAWTIPDNTYAPQAAGKIHSDFERGFIKAEIYHIDDLIEFKSEVSLKENGKIRQEGKDYCIQDGDIIFFKFNV